MRHCISSTPVYLTQCYAKTFFPRLIHLRALIVSKQYTKPNSFSQKAWPLNLAVIPVTQISWCPELLQAGSVAMKPPNRFCTSFLASTPFCTLVLPSLIQSQECDSIQVWFSQGIVINTLGKIDPSNTLATASRLEFRHLEWQMIHLLMQFLAHFPNQTPLSTLWAFVLHSKCPSCTASSNRHSTQNLGWFHWGKNYSSKETVLLIPSHTLRRLQSVCCVQV